MRGAETGEGRLMAVPGGVYAWPFPTWSGDRPPQDGACVRLQLTASYSNVILAAALDGTDAM